MDYVVGLDVSKDSLDLATFPERAPQHYPYTDAGLAALLSDLRALAPSLIVLEATGGFERRVGALLLTAGLPAAIVNPRQVRDYARALGYLAKTDRLDAGVLARFGAAIRPPVSVLPSAALTELQALVARRAQLVEMRTAEQHRLPGASGRVRRTLRDHLRWLDRQLDALDTEFDDWLDGHPDWRARYRRLRSVPGIGPVIARVLLAYLPELGLGAAKGLAALVGVAPFNCDSGRHKGQRHIWGGRALVRRALYMAALVAARRNPIVAAFYQHLLAQHKSKKVALVACMRKLLTILHALVKHGQDWNSNYVPESV